MTKNKKIKVAIVCDWLTNFGGAELVIQKIHELFPKAPIYTTVYNEAKMKPLKGAKIITSFIQKLPWAARKHQPFLFLMPHAVEQFDLRDFDVVISSSHSCAKGIITKPETIHICYCHSPMRYVWDDWHQYMREYVKSWFMRKLLPPFLSKLRIWDRLAADRVDYFIANSEYIAKRIDKYYQRKSKVIYPPVEIDNFTLPEKNNEREYFVAVGRLIPYKRFDLIVKAFNENGLPLKIVGVGKEFKKLRKLAKNNISFEGYVNNEDLNKLYQKSKALIFPQVEDFGIIPLEAMATGTPVIAFAKGGALETVINNKTGVFFKQQTVNSLNNAIQRFGKKQFSKEEIRKQAQKFSPDKFQKKIENLVNKLALK